MTEPIRLVLEIGAKRVFATAIDWPGWCRGGRSEEAAVENLLAHQDRYGLVVARAGLPFDSAGEAAAFEVAERLTGNATTDFGAPGVPAAADERPVDPAELDRQAGLLTACWETFDAVVAAARASGVVLAKGPRGGGRDVDRIEAHVTEAEQGYLTALGSRAPRPATSKAVRETALAALAAVTRGDPISNPSAVRNPWSPRFFVRRTAWHALDHAWEIENRSSSA